MVTSKHLVTALEKADRMDRLLIIAGLIFFFLVVLFILNQRIVDRGLRIALFWTRFIPRKSPKVGAVTNQMGQKDFTATVTTLTSIMTTTSLAASISRFVCRMPCRFSVY
jgi:protein transport protein SEC20